MPIDLPPPPDEQLLDLARRNARLQNEIAALRSLARNLGLALCVFALMFFMALWVLMKGAIR